MGLSEMKKTRFIIAGIDEGRERYLLAAKSTPNKTWVSWTDDKDEAHDFESIKSSKKALKHMDLPIPCVIVVRHDASF